jgi:pimeloyl-ACP methyl ester carboxylesterase
MIALGIAHKAPELVARLILISPVVWFELSGIVRLWQRFVPYPRLLDLIIGTSLGAGRRHHLVFLIALNAFIADRRGFYSNRKVFAAIGRGYEHMRQTQLSSIAGTTRVLTQADLRPMITQQPTTLPTLIIHGERDPIVPSTQSYWLANALPHAQLHIVPGVGHLAYGEQETIVNQSVADWLDRHPLEMRP